MAILVVFVGICFFIEIIWEFPISDSVNLIFMLNTCLISTLLILLLFLIMVLSFVMSSFKPLNVFSSYRNVNEYAIPTLFNSYKEYKTFVSSLSSGLF